MVKPGRSFKFLSRRPIFIVKYFMKLNFLQAAVIIHLIFLRFGKLFDGDLFFVIKILTEPNGSAAAFSEDIYFLVVFGAAIVSSV